MLGKRRRGWDNINLTHCLVFFPTKNHFVVKDPSCPVGVFLCDGCRPESLAGSLSSNRSVVKGGGVVLPLIGDLSGLSYAGTTSRPTHAHLLTHSSPPQVVPSVAMLIKLQYVISSDFGKVYIINPTIMLLRTYNIPIHATHV